MPRRVAMAGPRCPHQRHGRREVAYDGAVTSRAEIIHHAGRLVGSLSPSRVQACLTLLWPRPTAPLHNTHTQRILCRSVSAGGGFARGFSLTRPPTHSILTRLNSYLMSWETAATGVP